ncbi:hypothetical protein RJ639_028945 [Escallonia herrerae]|uniref:Strictosidine synthase n=1 Tax=Escallonia herrerae TaxID=1293975 RepID=A0AA89BKR7_9ASTE|nr:hypothetical protein RJ639_031525 [Escallonia herrerae]KAK3040232.1 hypothetical protein RJ639_028944 [Escallonia herrerae]KAK3040233.1 hypothetical protein RJ639_028945 [Escallonia herrerae]
MAGFRTSIVKLSTVVFICSQSIIFGALANLEKLPLPSPGPETFAFDGNGGGPYTGISDGRIVKYEGPTTGFVDFAYTAPNRPKALCDGTDKATENETLGLTCGRPMGLDFNHRTGELYLVDGFYGLLVVGPEGGLATQLAIGANGVPFRLLEAIDVDEQTGIVYFSDVTALYGMK